MVGSLSWRRKVLELSVHDNRHRATTALLDLGEASKSSTPTAACRSGSQSPGLNSDYRMAMSKLFNHSVDSASSSVNWE